MLLNNIMLSITEAFDDVSCAHDRAIWYFIESVLNTKCQFVSKQCESWDDYTSSKCGQVTSVLGIHSIDHSARGKFYLKTNDQSPFCSKY